MKRSLALLLALSLPLTFARRPAWADPAPAADDEEAKLLALLAEETAVATKTKINSDFVPGIVTVLHGEELEDLGIETAWEALSLVPGIAPQRAVLGDPSVIVRGLQFPFSVKVLIDGVSLSRESAGINSIALQVPIQQIDRIEVIRGPGSVIYGDNAFLGLVNIITRRPGERAYARYGGDHAVSGGGEALWSPASPWEIGVEGSAWKSTDAPVAEPLEADEKTGWGEFSIRRAGLSLTGEGIPRRVDASGPQGPVTPTEQAPAAIEAGYAWDLSPALHASLRAGYLHNHFQTNPTDFVGSQSSYGADWTWTGWKRHNVLFSVE